MLRLFVAIRPPAAVRQRLTAAMGGVAKARWQDDDQLHLTLRFVGEVDRHAAADVDAALSGVHHPGFALTLGGIGRFDRGGRIETLWIGATPQDAVAALKRKIDQALARVGIAPEGRAYLPHVTLARFGRDPGGIDGFVARSAALAGPTFAVDRFALFESRLTQDGAVYMPLATYRLDRPASDAASPRAPAVTSAQVAAKPASSPS